jgi:alpha-galactosidase
VDDAAGAAADGLVFTIYGDDRKLWASGRLKKGDPAESVDVRLEGIHSLLLKADREGADTKPTWGTWAEANFTFSGIRPNPVARPREAAVILTPKPPAEPRLNGPRVYGCRPGHPFLFRIPATGERPMRFFADALPPGLQLDAERGIISGTAPAPGTYLVPVRAENSRGAATRPLKIVSGDKLALTPPMGWNHWYAHYDRVTDALVREAADQLVRSGLADAGYVYVNIDDCWANTASASKDPRRLGPARDAAGNVLPNQYFPDMAALTAYIHARGLKAGIYSSPGPRTCTGYTGAYGHEEQDARQFAAWGFDFLKYDWCSYGSVADKQAGLSPLERQQHPYRLMGGLVGKLPRDIVFNLCQYGMGDVWEWGEAAGGQSWRTAGDLGAELNRLFEVAVKNAEHRAWSRPGSWNDPDYLQIGFVGDARTNGRPVPCPLTPTEQYAFMSLWCLSAAPLIYGGDLGALDDFTLNVLANPEVIDVDQDPLGEAARVVPLTPESFLMVKNLEDGSKAVGLCNRGETTAHLTARWAGLGLRGPQAVRDLWRQRDLGEFGEQFEATVPRHGVVLLRLTPR